MERSCSVIRLRTVAAEAVVVHRPVDPIRRSSPPSGWRQISGLGSLLDTMKPAFGPMRLGLMLVALIAAMVVAVELQPRSRPETGLVPSAAPGSLDAQASSSAASPSAPASAPASATPAPATSAPVGAVPIVPVADYRTTTMSIGPPEVAAVVHGTSKPWARLELVADEADAILETSRAAGSARPAPACFSSQTRRP